MSDFLPTADWDTLRLRARLARAVRDFFDARGFLEVDTPLLSADVVVDRHLDPFDTWTLSNCGASSPGRQMWLQTSPEFAMKRLLAAGGTAIYQITHAFRQAEQGSRHNPEFTLVEWYRTGDDMVAGMGLLADLAGALLNRGPAEIVSYRDAFLARLGVDPHRAAIDELAAAARRHGLRPPDTFDKADRDTWLDWLLVERIEPELGRGRPTIVCDYPASQAALARLRGSDPPLAERFELYVDGIELANGYHELVDADALRRRNRENNRLRAADGKPPLPEESRLLAAMDHGLPDCAGAALGFDRVVMLAAGKQTIAEVLTFPFERA